MILNEATSFKIEITQEIFTYSINFEFVLSGKKWRYC